MTSPATRLLARSTALALALLALSGTALGQGLTASMNEAQRALNEATIAAQQGRYDEARSRYQQAIQLNPRLVQAYEQYSLLLIARHLYDEGAKVVAAGLAANPGNKQLQGHLGIHRFQLGNVVEGQRLLRTAADAEGMKDRYEVQLVLVQASLLLEDYRTAITAIGRYLAHRPAALAERDYSLKVQLARAHMYTDALDVAERELKRVLAERPQSMRAHVAQAELDLRLRRCKPALDRFQRLQLLSHNLEVPLFVGEALLCLKRPAEAATIADRFLAEKGPMLQGLLTKPAHGHQPFAARIVLRHAYALRGETALRLGKYENALASYREVMALSGGSEASQIRVAEVLFHLKQYDKSLEQLSTALKQDPPPRSALVLGVRAGVRAKQLPTALRCAAELGKVQKPTGEEQYYAGIAYASAGQFQAAVTLFRKAVQLDPKHPGPKEELEKALIRLARREFAQKNLEAAHSLLTEALAAAPQSPLVNQNLALVLLKQDKPALALGPALSAANALPKSGTANRLAGRALLVAGRAKDAIVRYQRAIERGGLSEVELALVHSDLGVARLRSGQLEAGIADLEQASKLLPKQSPHLKVVQGNLVRSRLARGLQLIDANNMAQALKELDQAQRHAVALADEERAMLNLGRILALAHTGNTGGAREIWRKEGEKLLKSFEASFADLSDAVPAYIDAHSGAAGARADLVRRLERLHARASSPARDKMRDLLVSVYMQSAFKSYEEGKNAAAMAMLNKAKRSARALTPEAKHNIAVAEYQTAGTREGAVKALETLGAKVPLSLCNLAIHFDGKGATAAKAYDLFKQCNQRGVRFPNLKNILAVKRLVFGN
jgi:tetratricopeptide (TPR) repeat protein